MAPLTPAVVHVMLALAGGERHGYAILKDVQRLMEAGWVEETAAPVAATDERRRYYRLTRTGREALKAEVDRLGALLDVARAHRIQPRGSRG